MSAAVLPAATAADAHRAFDAAVGRIDATIRQHFRRWPRGRREEAVAEARALTWATWHGLLLRGEDPVAVGPVAIAVDSCLAVENGRTIVARRPTGRVAGDAFHLGLRRELAPRVVPLEPPPGMAPGRWQDWLISGRNYDPADEAAFRIDFAAWLAGLPERRRRAVELLAEGLGTYAVARRLGVKPGAVSRTRMWLARSWARFQSDPDAE